MKYLIKPALLLLLIFSVIFYHSFIPAQNFTKSNTHTSSSIKISALNGIHKGQSVGNAPISIPAPTSVEIRFKLNSPGFSGDEILITSLKNNYNRSRIFNAAGITIFHNPATHVHPHLAMRNIRV